MRKKNKRKWNDPKAIRKSLTNLLNAYIDGEIEAEVLRNAVYAANCLLAACKQVTDEELQELKDIVAEIQENNNNK